MPTYTDAPERVHQLLAKAVSQWHSELLEVEVTFLVQMVHASRDKDGEPTGPAIKWGGSGAAAIVRITPLKDRQAGLADVRLLLDGDTWDSRSEAEQLAILDHECEHIEVCRDKEGAILADDIGRPKLRLRPHDWLMGGFDEVMQRHRENALETKHADSMVRKWRQLDLPWG